MSELLNKLRAIDCLKTYLYHNEFMQIKDAFMKGELGLVDGDVDTNMWAPYVYKNEDWTFHNHLMKSKTWQSGDKDAYATLSYNEGKPLLKVRLDDNCSMSVVHNRVTKWKATFSGVNLSILKDDINSHFNDFVEDQLQLIERGERKLRLNNIANSLLQTK